MVHAEDKATGAYAVFDSPMLEDALLERLRVSSIANSWKRFLARFLRKEVHVGTFKILEKLCVDCYGPNSRTDFMDYFIFWCSVHSKYKVSRRHGYGRVLVCQNCEKERTAVTSCW